MTELPGGSVTFLMTDVEGSTRLWEQHPEAMTAVLTRHDRIVADAVTEAGGILLRDRSEGDSSFAVFADARAASDAAVRLQRGLGRATWPLALRIRARAAIHTGEASPRSGSYYGPTVNRVVRLRSIGHGGQTLVSGGAAEGLGDRLPTGCSLRDLGRHRLKDVARHEQVFELVHPDLEQDHPPLRSLEVERHNLPAPPGSLFGRSADVRHLAATVAAERVTTALGPGGVGKTRLALEAARGLLERFAGGTWFVDFSRLPSGAADASGALATVLGLREQPGRPLIDTVADAIGAAPVLLLLDNCEHVVDAVRGAAAVLLQRCPSLHVLATSRERLGLPGERTLRIEPLPHDTAVELFGDRSALPRSPAAEAICVRLEGIPLAIEMAAAAATARGADAVLDSLSSRLGDLGSGTETLRATIDWSHRLLGPAQQVLFRRLGAFLGPFDLDAVEGVCADPDLLPVDEVLDLLGDLVDASLLLLGGGGGYRLLAPIREHAADALAGSGELGVLRARHLLWYRDVADALERRLESDDPGPALDRLELEHDNLVGALAWSDPAADRDAQLALAIGLWRFWDLTGRWSEGRTHLEVTLARGSTYRTFLSTAHFRLGALAERQSDVDAAQAHQRASVKILDAVTADLAASGSDQLTILQVHREVARSRLAELARLAGDLDEAFRLAAAADETLRELGEDQLRAAPLQCLAHVARQRGDHATAAALLSDALVLARAHESAAMEGQLRNDLGVLDRERGRLDEADGWYRSSLDLRDRIRDRGGAAEVRYNLAELHLVRGHLDPAEVDRLRLDAEEAGDDRRLADVELLAGDARAHDEPDSAAQHYEKAGTLRRRLGLENGVLEADLRLVALRGSADVDALVRRAERSAEPATVLEALVTVVRARPEDDRSVAWLRRAWALASGRPSALERARVVETAAALVGDPAALAAVDGWRAAVGATTMPRDLRWRAHGERLRRQAPLAEPVASELRRILAGATGSDVV